MIETQAGSAEPKLPFINHHLSVRRAALIAIAGGCSTASCGSGTASTAINAENVHPARLGVFQAPCGEHQTRSVPGRSRRTNTAGRRRATATVGVASFFVPSPFQSSRSRGLLR